MVCSCPNSTGISKICEQGGRRKQCLEKGSDPFSHQTPFPDPQLPELIIGTLSQAAIAIQHQNNLKKYFQRLPDWLYHLYRY